MSKGFFSGSVCNCVLFQHVVAESHPWVHLNCDHWSQGSGRVSRRFVWLRFRFRDSWFLEYQISDVTLTRLFRHRIGLKQFEIPISK